MRLKGLLTILLIILGFTVKLMAQCTPAITTNPALAQGCEIFTIQFFDVSVCTEQQRLWLFGDGTNSSVQNPSHTFNAGLNGDTTYSVELRVQDVGLSWHSKFISVKVFAKPKATIVKSAAVACAINDSILFTNTAPMPLGSSASWDFGDGSSLSTKNSVYHKFNTPATYTVTLTVTNVNNCSKTATSSVTINEIPNPNFSLSEVVVCNPRKVTFTNTTVVGTFPISAWSWDFGGLGSSTVKQPLDFNFLNAGTYPISLTATNTAGCTNTTKNNVFVNPTPTATFTVPSKVCMLDTATVLYTGTGDPAATYTWGFASPLVNNGSGQGPIDLAWNTSGTKTISLTVKQANCTASSSKSIYVAPLPEVSLTSNDVNDSICEEQTILFTALPDSFVTYQFYNLGILQQSTFSNSYSVSTLSSPNIVVVTATDTSGCASSSSNAKSVTVLQKPTTVLTASTDSICEGGSISFSADGGFDSYIFYDGFLPLQSGVSPNFTSNLLEQGVVIKAAAVDHGCLGALSNEIAPQVIAPLEKPVVNCGKSTIGMVTFLWDDDVAASSYQISINGGAFAPSAIRGKEIRTGLTPGDIVTANVISVGTAPCGNSIVSDTMTCIAQPCDSITFDKSIYTNFCAQENAVLSIKSIVSPSAQYGISWDKGPFSKVNTFAFTATTARKVVVQVIDSTQLACPVTQKVFNITVHELPVIDLTARSPKECQFDYAEFSATQAGYNNYKFYVNDTLKQDSAYHKMAIATMHPGLNRVSVLVNDAGCLSEDSLTIDIIPKPLPAFTVSSDSVCKGEEMSYKVLGNFDYYKFNRTGTSRVLLDSTLNVYTSAVENKITIVGTDENGCHSYAADIKVVQKSLPLAVFYSIPSVDSLCAGDSITLAYTKSGYDNYEFWDNYYLKSSGSSFFYKVGDLQNNHAYYGRTQNDGCFSKISDTLYFKVREKLKQPVANCGLTGNGQMQFTWDPIDRNQGYTISVNGGGYFTPSTGNNGLAHIVTGLAPLDTVCLKVIAKGAQPCGNSIASVAACCIMPCSPVTFDQNFTYKEVCAGQSVTVQVNNIHSPSGKYLMAWNNDAPLKIFSRKFTPTKDTVVTIAIWDTKQVECTPTIKYFTVKVHALPVVTIAGDTTFCSNEQIVLKASPDYYDNYQFYDRYLPIASGLNPTQIDQNIQNGHFYTVVATYRGCKDTSERHFIHVSPKLQIPDIYCGTTSTSTVEILWDAVPTAIGYEISVNGFPYQTPSAGIAGLQHLRTGMTAGDSLVVMVRAAGATPCLTSEDSKKITCYAKNCAPVNFSKGNDLNICAGDLVTVAVGAIQTPSANYGISWDGGLTYSKTTSFSKKVYSDSMIAITIIDSVQLGCPLNTKDILVNVQEIPALKLISNKGNDSICQGELLQIQSDVIGYDGYKFFIDNVLVQDSLFYIYSSSSLAVGNHKIKVNSAYNACYFLSDSTTFNVVSFPQLVLSSSDANDSICAGNTVVFKANAGFENYSFYQNGALQQSTADSVFSVSTLVNGEEVYCIGNNRFLCSRYSDTIATAVTSLTIFSLSSSDLNNIVCANDTVVFTVSPSPDYFFVYNKSDSLKRLIGSTFQIDTLETSDLISVKASMDGCVTTSNAIQTSVQFTPTASISKDTASICVGQQVQLTATGGASYLWSNGDLDSAAVFSPSQSTYAWVKTKVNNCTSRGDSIHIYVDALKPNADAGANELICRYDSVQLFASGGLVFHWLNGDSISNKNISDPFVHPVVTSTYTVEVGNVICRDTAKVTVEVDKCLKDLEKKIVEIFTPNKDGKHDFFVVPDIDYFTKNKLTVYNRWSNEVYSASPYNNEWEGTNQQGANLPDGTYFIVLDLGNGKAPYTGFVMIQR